MCPRPQLAYPCVAVKYRKFYLEVKRSFVIGILSFREELKKSKTVLNSVPRKGSAGVFPLKFAKPLSDIRSTIRTESESPVSSFFIIYFSKIEEPLSQVI